MKQHVGPIYLILGLMAVSTLTIGAGKPQAAPGQHVVRAQALLPSPTSFHFTTNASGQSERILVIGSAALDGEIEAKVSKALAANKARKAG